MKIKIILAILISGILIIGKGMTQQTITDPLYFIEFEVFGTGAEIFLNDIPVHTNDSKGTTRSEIQVPQYIQNGKNTLTIRSFPLEAENNSYREGANVNVSLVVRGKNDPSSNNLTLLQFNLNPTLDENHIFEGTNKEISPFPAKVISKTDKELIASRDVDLKTNLPIWAWLSGKTIENTPENYNSLLASYKKIYSAMETGNKQQVREIYKYSAAEIAAAYHHTDIVNGYSIISSEHFIDDPKWQLLDINEMIADMNYKLDIRADGKLARIIDDDNDSPIVFLHDDKMVAVIPFFWYKNSNNDWIMIR